MSQTDVIKVLSKEDDWFTKKEIFEKLQQFGYQLSERSLNESLTRLVKQRYIIAKESPTLARGYLYKIRDVDE